MIRHIRTILATLIIGGGVVAAAAPSVSAIDLFTDPCGSGNSGDTAVCKGKGDKVTNLVQSITSIMLWALGAVTTIMLIVGGFKYVTSNGDSNKIQAAKNTILYAVIGLAVAILGQVIVLYVVKWF